MSYGKNHVSFRPEALDDVRGQTNTQQDRYREIWDGVHSELLGLIERGEVDASLGGVLEERDQEFRRQSNRFDDDVESAKRAGEGVKNAGLEGGHLMRRAASGSN